MLSIVKDKYFDITRGFALVDEDIQRYEEFKGSSKKEHAIKLLYNISLGLLNHIYSLLNQKQLAFMKMAGVKLPTSNTPSLTELAVALRRSPVFVLNSDIYNCFLNLDEVKNRGAQVNIRSIKASKKRIQNWFLQEFGL